MKNNLKTMPIETLATKLWKEAFEKELRELLNAIKEDGTSNILLETFIEEILGDG